MGRTRCSLLVVAALVAGQLGAPHAHAQQLAGISDFDDGSLTAFTITAENDVLFQLGHNMDRNYTGGFAFQSAGSFVRKGHLDAPLRAIDRLTTFRQWHEAFPRRYYSLMIVGTGFTPDSLKTTVLLPEDRPYGSIVGISVRRLTVNDKSFDEAWSSELTLGMLGLHVARNLQTWLHRRIRAHTGKPTPYDPLGWSNQISDGGEPTALYRVNYERRLLGDLSGPNTRKRWQLVGGAQGSAGYYTNATLLTSARVGWFVSDFWEFTPSATNIATQNLGGGRRHPPRWELAAFGGLRPRVIAYNALLQGQFKSNPHEFSAAEIRRLQLEWELGAAAYVPICRAGLQIVWNVYAGRTAEFDAAESRTHTWGSILAVFSIPVKPLGMSGGTP